MMLFTCRLLRFGHQRIYRRPGKNMVCGTWRIRHE